MMHSTIIRAKIPAEMDFAFFVVDWKMLNRLYMAMTMQVIMGRLNPIRVRPSAELAV